MRRVKEVLKSCLYRIKYSTPKVLSTNETIDYIVKNKVSIGRFGDGELAVLMGKSISFQDYDKNLSESLKQIKTTDRFLVCIPNIFNKAEFNKNTVLKKEYRFWEREKFIRKGFWNKYFNKNSLIGDAFLSRFYLRYLDKSNTKNTVDQLKKIWDGRNIVFVEGASSRLGVGNDLFDNAKSIKRILCPQKNSYERVEEIKNVMLNIGEKDTLFILALGPTATALAYEMSNNFQCLDLGHIDIEYEWFRMGATEKVPIPTKYVNECEDGRNPNEIKDEKYLNEIVYRVE